MSEGKPGLLGALVARAEAHVMRTSALYAVLDQDALIRPHHLLAALALWQYCADSITYLFGDRLGDPGADQVLDELRRQPKGLTRTDMHTFFKGHMSKSRLDRALTVLEQHGRVRAEKDEETGGRPAKRWRAV